MEHREFPLLLWERTEEFGELFKKAQEKFEEIEKRWRALGGTCTIIGGSWQVNENGEPEFWLNSNGGSGYKGMTAEKAKDLSIKHGQFGWWAVKDFEELLEGKGPMFETAMDYCYGFFTHKNIYRTWARTRPHPQHTQHC